MYFNWGGQFHKDINVDFIDVGKQWLCTKTTSSDYNEIVHCQGDNLYFAVSATLVDEVLMALTTPMSMQRALQISERL